MRSEEDTRLAARPRFSTWRSLQGMWHLGFPLEQAVKGKFREVELTGNFVAEPWLLGAHRKVSGVRKVGNEVREGPCRAVWGLVPG